MDEVRPKQEWKWIALVALVAAASSLAALITVFPLRKKSDHRLLGTWQSDAERTIAGIKEIRPVDEKQEAALRQLFGKMRLTYTATTYRTELNGSKSVYQYEVLGKDKHSVVVRDVNSPPSPLEEFGLESSEFTVIQFDGPDAYWVITKIGDMREYFKRVE